MALSFTSDKERVERRGVERRGEAGNEAERRAKNWVNAWGVPPMITAMRLSTALERMSDTR